ncbi:hypothetical protein [Aeromicrobium alkaliterrae]|uniref:Uncharacterized protein n=1 Tax=Aeromicrobium alkaliterrae TaxID=302168 RepID=A0ABN2KF54_9ACTN
MPDRSIVTAESFQESVGALRSGALRAVRYFCAVEHLGWDEGPQHVADMGVELDFGNRTVVVSWGDAFGHFGLELQLTRGSELFKNNPTIFDVTHHDFWQPFVGGRLEATDIWRTGVVGATEPAPVAVNLRCRGQDLWVVAAEDRLYDGLWLGADSLMVTRDPSWVETHLGSAE